MVSCNGLYCTIADYPGSNGVIPLLYSIRDGIPGAWEGILLCIMFILFAGNYFLIKNKTGRAKILIALLSSSFMMIPLSSLLALASLVTFTTVLLYAFITIVVFIVFLVSDNN
jgi:hypothetical protein